MPDSVRVFRSTVRRPLVVKSAAPGAFNSHVCVSEWGDFRDAIRGSILGMGFGMGLWAVIFGLLVLLFKT